MKDDFKEKLKKDGRSLKWFYDLYVRDQLKITYVYMTSQLNGFSTLTDDLKNIIESYGAENNEMVQTLQ